jgi:hypothetical protein
MPTIIRRSGRCVCITTMAQDHTAIVTYVARSAPKKVLMTDLPPSQIWPSPAPAPPTSPIVDNVKVQGRAAPPVSPQARAPARQRGGLYPRYNSPAPIAAPSAVATRKTGNALISPPFVAPAPPPTPEPVAALPEPAPVLDEPPVASGSRE